MFRYMQCRGNSKRHTMANPEEVHQCQNVASTSGTQTTSRTRRTGLLTVMERPPGMLIKYLILIKILIVHLWCAY